MNNQHKHRIAELLTLFVLLPVALSFYYHIAIKLGLAILGIAYAVYISYKEGLFKSTSLNFSASNNYWKGLWLRFIPAAIMMLAFIYLYDESLLFKVLLSNPGLYVIILFVYTFLSVIPQEFLYRVFFFHRYKILFKNENLFVLVNGLIFSLAHIFFLNGLVMILTFIGGLIFAYTYQKTSSFLITSFEHTIYGIWIFTIGMGDMLAFPG